MANLTINLPSEVAAKYKLVNWVGGHRQNFGSFGDVDLSKLTLERADRLYLRKFPKLVLKDPQKEAPKVEATGKK